MLKVVTGPFHPDLEQALVDEVQRRRATDPLGPLAIVVPSTRLVSRLQALLVGEHRLSLLNTHFLTFRHFALRLDRERQAASQPPGAEPPIQSVGDLFFEHLVSRVVASGLSGLEGLRLGAAAPGTWAALWSAVRDLKDAAVDPGVALRAVEEGVFDPQEAPQLRGLFTLYAAVLESSRTLQVGGPDDLAATVLPWVPASPFLKSLRGLCYYGFYDLTQIQLSLFEQVASCATVTLFYPLAEETAYAFSRRFFERHLQPSVQRSEQIVKTGSVGPARQAEEAGVPGASMVRLFNVAGPEEEVNLVCKEILSLVETHGYRFEDIGVVARSLEPYGHTFPRLFDRHRIPFVTTAARPILQEPAVKLFLQLARLPLSGLYRPLVMGIVTSAHYRVDRNGAQLEPRPDLWRLAVETLGITRGEEEWRRLASCGGVEAPVGSVGEDDPDAEHRVGVPAEQVGLLWRVVRRLIAETQALPREGTIRELTEAFCAFAARHVAIPGLSEEGASEEPREEPRRDGAPLEPGPAIKRALGDLAQLDRIEGTVTWDVWTRLLARALERTTIPISADAHVGVQVLDAMAARGLPFRALFVLGLNEKLFPRFIREDAFLRDRARRVLDETLGFKIDEKLAGYDEEILLFTLLVGAARHRLYLVYQRADADGRALAPSFYLVPWLSRDGRLGAEPPVRVPRSLAERRGMPHFAPSYLTREELAVTLVLDGLDPSRLLEAVGRGPVLFQTGWQALLEIEGDRPRGGPHDGFLPSPDRFWQALAARGVAPTPLEQYARCPFQYFSAQVLRLKAVRFEKTEEVPAQVFGELCHRVLQGCYRHLLRDGWPTRVLTAEAIRDRVRTVTDDVSRGYVLTKGTGYPLLWELALDTVAALVSAAVESDQAEFRASGYRPFAFEVLGEGTLEGVGEPGVLPLRGRLDRVDQDPARSTWRVVDYKFRQSRRITSQDRDLVTAALRGYRLQPPLYTRMTSLHTGQDGDPGRPLEGKVTDVRFLYLAPHWEPMVQSSTFSSEVWGGDTGSSLRQTLRVVLDGIREGRFFILPDTYCDFCDFTPACRRFHGPTWWRARAAPGARALRELRRKKGTP